MAKKVGVTLALDREKEFVAGFQAAAKATRLYKEELKSVVSEFDGAENSMAALAKKQGVLEKSVDALKRKQEAAAKGLSNANKAYDEQADVVANLQKKLDAAADKVKEFADAGDDSSDGYRQAVADLKKYEQAVAGETAALSKAEGRVLSWQTRVEQSSRELREADQELAKNAQYMDEASRAADGCATSIDNFGREVGEATDGLSEAGERTSKFGELVGGITIGSLAADGLRALGNAAKEAAQYVVAVGSGFEASMSKVQALSGATTEELAQIEEKAKALGSSTQFSAQQVADGFSYMSLAGWSTEEMLAGIDGVVNLAAASEMDLAEASDMVTDYLSAFGLAASDAGKMADEMAYAQARSNTSTKQLGDAFKNSAANMHAAGQSMETTTAILEALANQGTKGGEAGTQLAAIMRDLTSKMEDGAISIGDTTVAVQDANGDFRDLCDIMADVEEATTGMGTAERSAALQSTFTARSIKGVNQILTEGVGSIKGYRDELESADGAAADMATTMQDNLAGKIKALGSATEGLGIQVFGMIDGPLEAGVDFLTGVVGGLNDLLAGSKTEASEAADAMKDATDAMMDAIEASGASWEDYEGEAEKVDILTRQIFALASEEERSEGQKLRLKAAADELGKIIPELSGLYDEQTDSLTKTRAEVDALTDAYKNQQIDEHFRVTNKALLDAQTDAGVALAKGEANLENLEKQATLYQEIQDSASMAIGRESWTESDFAGYIEEQTQRITAALDDGTLSAAEYEEAMALLPKNAAGFETTMHNANVAYLAAEGQVDDLKGAVDELKSTYDDSSAALEENEAAFDRYKDSLRETTAETADGVVPTFSLSEGRKEEADATKEAADGYDEYTAELEEANGVTDDASVAAQVLAKKHEEAAAAAEESAKAAEEGAKRVAEAYKGAADAVRDAFDEAMKSARDAVSFDFLSEKFDGGVDEAVSVMIDRAAAQVAALEDYEANLRTVSDHLGKEISPQFLQYLEGMGTSGANMLARIAEAFETDEGSEQVREWSDKYVDALSIQDRAADRIANDAVAIQGALGQLGGSTAREFQALRDAINDVAQAGTWDGFTDGMAAALNDAVTQAQAIGAKIPDSLAEGIAGGEVDAQNALDVVTAAVSGHFDALVEQAEARGKEVPASIRAGIEGDTQQVVEAYNALLAIIANDDGEAAEQASAKGTEAATAFGSAISDNSDAATTGATSLKDAATGALEETSEFTANGTASATEYANGLTAQSESVKSAAQGLANGAANAISSTAGEFYGAGQNMAAGVASGITAGSYLVTSAMRSVAQAALSAAMAELDIHSPSRKFRDLVGKQIPRGVAEGIDETAKDAEASAEEMSQAVLKSSTAWLDSYKQAHRVSIADEKWYWQQVVDACAKGTNAYAQAQEKVRRANMSNIASRTVLRGEDAYAIAGNFDVSRTETKGTGDKVKTVRKDAEKYYSEIYSAASKYLDNMSTLHEYSLQEELQYWVQVQARLKKGSQGWFDAQKQINAAKASIKKAAEDAAKEVDAAAKAAAAAQDKLVSGAAQKISRFAIRTGADMALDKQLKTWEQVLRQVPKYSDAWYDAKERINEVNEAIADAAKAAARAQVDAANEVIRATEKEIEREKLIREVTPEQERDRWRGVLDGLKKGTDAWWEVYAKVKGLNDQIREAASANGAEKKAAQTVATQSKILSSWKSIYKVGERAEMEYWDAARKTWKRGTDDWLEAEANYQQARATYYENRKALDEEYAASVADIQDRLRDQVDELSKAYADAVESRKKSILSSMSLFAAWDSESDTGDVLLKNLESQVKGLAFWEEQIKALESRHVTAGLLEELREMGPDAAASLYALTQMTDDELARYDELWRQREALATRQATRENAGLLAENNAALTQARRDANDELRTLNAQYTDDLTAMERSMTTELSRLVTSARTIGEDVAKALAEGMRAPSDVASVYKSTQPIIGNVEAELQQIPAITAEVGATGIDALLASMADVNKIRSGVQSTYATLKEELFAAQDALQAELDGRRLDLGYGAARAMNATLASGGAPAAPAVLTDDRLVGLLTQIAALVGQDRAVVMDTGALVGALQEPLSRANAAAYVVQNGGRL